MPAKKTTQNYNSKNNKNCKKPNNRSKK